MNILRFYTATMLCLMILGALLLETKQSNAGVQCSDAGRIAYQAPMQFCMRTGIYISAVGVITQNTPNEFLRFLSKVDKLGFTPAAVTFHSPGGSLFGGLTLGSIIRERKLHTRVGQNSDCSSACMVAFIGGRSRKVAHNGSIGNHQFALDADDRVVQSLIAFVSDYHKRMDVSPLAVEAAMTRTPDEMYWYSPQEISEWGIVTRR